MASAVSGGMARTKCIGLVLLMVASWADAKPGSGDGPSNSHQHKLVPAGTLTLDIGVGVPCSKVRTATLTSLRGKLQHDVLDTLHSIWPWPRKSPCKDKAQVEVQYVGCQNAASGWAIAFGVNVYAPRGCSEQLSGCSGPGCISLLEKLVKAVNSSPRTSLPHFCKASATLSVEEYKTEAMCPPRPSDYKYYVPLGWTGFDGTRKMLLPLTLGSQRQKMAVVLDTGSTVPFTEGFDWQQSTTFVNTSEPGSIEFGGAGGITGYFGNDTTTVGPITATNFEFLVADGDSGTGGKGSGLYGFALGSYALPCGEASDQVSTWKQLSTAAGVAGTELDRVGLWLSNDQQFLQAATSFGGELDIAHLNSNRFTGEPVWVPVVPADSSVRSNAENNTLVWWQFLVKRMAIEYADGSSQDICTECNTIADSGWPEIVITPKAEGAMAKASLTGASPALGCAYKLLVDFGAPYGSVRMNLTADGLPPVANCATNYPATGGAAVFSDYRVNGLVDGVDNWFTLGLPFLRQFYTVFDYNSLQIGFYTSVQG